MGGTRGATQGTVRCGGKNERREEKKSQVGGITETLHLSFRREKRGVRRGKNTTRAKEASSQGESGKKFRKIRKVLSDRGEICET